MPTLPRRLLLAAVAVATVALASPMASAAGAHEGELADLSTEITFLAPELWTVTSAAGTSFGGGAPNPALVYPEAFWGTFPGYHMGHTMRFTVTLANTAIQGNRRYTLTVRSASNVVRLDGSDGQAIGAPQEWTVEDLAPGETRVIEGSVAITGDNLPIGLDVTRISISHPNRGNEPTAGLIKVVTGIWCPPDADEPAIGSANN